jgi:hypothetical protein
VPFGPTSLAKASAAGIALNQSIFINCPFDEAFRSCFEAILFTVTMSGYRVRCALEADDAGDVRFEKLCELIADCDRSIHDLSRTQSGVDGLPRFNMPFELGLMMGARQYGRGRQRAKRAMIMVSKPFAMPRFLSDLAGNDPKAHEDNALNVIRIVRDHLHTDPSGSRLPGAAHMADLMTEFRNLLPSLAAAANLTMGEIHPFQGYRNYMDLLRGYRQAIYDIAD